MSWKRHKKGQAGWNPADDDGGLGDDGDDGGLGDDEDDGGGDDDGQWWRWSETSWKWRRKNPARWI